MYGEIDKKLIFKFLDRNYPVSRIKHNGRFKRAIVLDDGQPYLLGLDHHQIQLKFKLTDIIKKIFDCDEAISRTVIGNFLRLS